MKWNSLCKKYIYELILFFFYQMHIELFNTWLITINNNNLKIGNLKCIYIYINCHMNKYKNNKEIASYLNKLYKII